MSPEQARFGPADVDTRSDVYALGVVLYELLTGTTPLRREVLKRASFEEMLRLVREGDPEKPSTRVQTQTAPVEPPAASTTRRLSSQLRGDLDWICLKALEKERDRRYGSAVALASDLAFYLAGEAVLASPPSLRYRGWKWIKRHRVATATGGLVASSVVAAAIVSTAFYLREKKAAEDLAEEVAKQQERADFLAIMVGDFKSNKPVAKEVFDRALASLENMAAPKPEHKALKLATLAAFYSQLGETAKAGQLAEESLGLMTGGTDRLLGLDKRRLSDFANYVAIAGKRALSEKCAREVLRQERAGIEPRRLQGALESLAGKIASEQPEEAGRLWREACEIKRKLLASGIGGIGGAFGNYAQFLRRHGQLSEAESYAREQVANDDHFLGVQTPHTNRIVYREGLLAILREEHKDEEATKVVAEIEAIKKLAGSNSQVNSVKGIMASGAKALAQNKLDEARANYTLALATLTSAYGRDNVDRIICLRGLAAIELRRANPEAAENMLREALALARKQNVISSEALVVMDLSNAWAQQRRYADGATLFQECQPLLDNPVLPAFFRVALVRQARSFFQKQNDQQADPILEKRIAEMDEKLKTLEAGLRH